MRGRYKLHTQLKLGLEQQADSGDNRSRRSEAIASRFYYYHSLIGYRYELCLRELHREFFLSEATIIDILLRAQQIINSLSENKTTAQQLSKEYPHIKW